MDKYVINKDFTGEREVKAAGYTTIGEFIDFYEFDGDGDTVVTLRIRASRVETIERIAA